MKIIIGADHAGYLYKQRLIEYLKYRGHTVEDYGTDSTESVDYPVFAKKVAHAIAQRKADYGILICGTGIGMSMAANKVKGIRAALCTDVVMAEYARAHNRANILCMGARISAYEMCAAIADKFIASEFLGFHHQVRLDMLEED